LTTHRATPTGASLSPVIPNLRLPRRCASLGPSLERPPRTQIGVNASICMGLEPRTTGRALTPSKAYVSGMCLSHGSALCALDLLSRRRAGLGCPAVAGGFRGRSHNFSQHSCARSLGFRLQELPDLPIWILPNSARSRSGRSGVPASRGTLNKSNKNATMR